MLNLLDRLFSRIKEVYGPRHFAALVVLTFMLSGAGIAVGVKYGGYIRHDPEYCNSCHLMREAFAQWASSDHKGISCQQCHELTSLEQNALLIKQIIFGRRKLSQKHGKKLPWKSCPVCHWEEKSQPNHVKHQFVECFNCHPFSGHNFPSDKTACAKCHRITRTHGVLTDRLSCTGCHIFRVR